MDLTALVNGLEITQAQKNIVVNGVVFIQRVSQNVIAARKINENVNL
jgi:hypothetical protein